jgi:hypothetical protein
MIFLPALFMDIIELSLNLLRIFEEIVVMLRMRIRMGRMWDFMRGGFVEIYLAYRTQIGQWSIFSFLEVEFNYSKIKKNTKYLELHYKIWHQS